MTGRQFSISCTCFTALTGCRVSEKASVFAISLRRGWWLAGWLITPYEVWLIPTSRSKESWSQLSPSIRSTTEISKSLAQISVCGRPLPYFVHRSFNPLSLLQRQTGGEGVQTKLGNEIDSSGEPKNKDLSVYIRRVTTQKSTYEFGLRLTTLAI